MPAKHDPEDDNWFQCWDCSRVFALAEAMQDDKNDLCENCWEDRQERKAEAAANDRAEALADHLFDLGTKMARGEEL